MTVVLLLLSTGAFLPFLAAGNGGGGGIVQGIFGILYLLVAVALYPDRQQAFYVARSSRLLVWLVVFALMSVFWSAAPAVTIRRSVALICSVITAIYLVVRYSDEELLRMLALVFAIAALGSLMVGAVLPEFGLQQDIRGVVWKGVFSHKNHLGRAMAFGILVWLVLMMRSGSALRVACSVPLVISFGLLLLSDSATALALTFGVVVVWGLVALLRLHPLLTISAVLLLFLGAALATLFLTGNYEETLQAFGRDASLTGRTFLWVLVWLEIMNAPLIGHGYGAYWLGLDGPSRTIWSRMHWEAPHAHNGLLDVGLELGFIGVLLVVLILAKTLASALRAVRRWEHADAYFILTFILMTIAVNAVENTMLEQNSLYWILFAAIVFRTNSKSAPERELEPGSAGVAAAR